MSWRKHVAARQMDLPAPHLSHTLMAATAAAPLPPGPHLCPLQEGQR